MLDFFSITEPGEYLWLLILALGAATFITRIGGYLLISRFHTIPPKVHAALEAVPVAVLTALVVPSITKGWAELITLIAVALACLRLSTTMVLFAGLGLLIILRWSGI